MFSPFPHMFPHVSPIVSPVCLGISHVSLFPILGLTSFITDTIFERKYGSKKSIKFEPMYVSQSKK